MGHLDHGLAVLLDLDGQIIEQEAGYWIKIEARLVEASEAVPHRIRYSLTLHDLHGTRVLGYDNAHPVKRPKKFKYAGQRRAYDHRLRAAKDKGVFYSFQSPQQLLEDFFADVARVLKEIKSS